VLRKGDAAVVEFSPLRPSLIMAHKESPSMGCFVIREKQYVVSE
jgi:translation elongation factor EF-1alpha